MSTSVEVQELFKKRRHTRYPCRCKTCSARTTFSKHPDTYAVMPKCKNGHRNGFLVDWYRLRIEAKKNTCCCDGYPHPHDRTTSPWCKDHPRGPNADQIRDRYGEEAAQDFLDNQETT